MQLRAGVASDRGLVRQTNEDSYLVRRGLYAVCDGMGGARAGEVASAMACRELLALDPATAGSEELRGVIAAANEAIARRSLEEERLSGMGTTLTAALAAGNSLSLAHIGDSRAYLLRGGSLTQLTDDHSWVGEMVRRGDLTPAQAAVHPHRSVITKALGTGDGADADIFEVPIEAGDRVLLCSDGLTGMVSDSEIAEILGRDEDPQTVAGMLVRAALDGGGEDNVTVVVLDIGPAGAGSGPDETGSDQMDSEQTSFDQSGDEVLMGPDDRGVLNRARAGRGGLSGAGVRGRLGGRVGPLLRPHAARSSRSALSTTTSMKALDLASAEPSAKIDPATDPAAEIAPGAERAERARGWTRRKWIMLATVVLVVLAIAIVSFAAYNWTVYYVGVFDGTVALYHGLPGSVLGIALSSVIERGTTSYDSLPPFLQARVDAHGLLTKEEGQLFLRSLSAQR
jgi:serine/threonine protein phosphatase PrpC